MQSTPQRLRFPFTGSKIDWNLNPDLTAEYKRIIAFRNASAAIRRGKVESFTTDDICAFTKSLGKEKVFVVVNLRDRAVDFAVPPQIAKGRWKSAMGNTANVTKRMTLKPYEYNVYKN